MGYNIRAFCAADEVPTIGGMLQWLESREVRVKVEQVNGSVPLDSPDWHQVKLIYKPGKEPIAAECARDNGDDSSPVKQLIRDFLDRIGPPGKSQSKRRVTSHLKATRYVITLDLPSWDMDNDGYDTNGQILTFLGERYGALVHAEREGFYDGDKLILQME